MKILNNIIRAALVSLLPFAATVPAFGQAVVTAPVNDAPRPAAPVTTSPASPAEEDQEGEDVIILEEFSVKATKDASYIGATATAGARVVADILELPFSIQVLSKDFIDDFQLLDFEDQAAYIGGMTPGDPATGAPSNSLRGYSVPVFRNGFRRTQRPESNSIRQTEVIRGPQSALFGRTSPGGVVNMLSKQPQTKFKTGVTGIYGSYNNRRASAYVTGPLIGRKLYYRVDTEYYDMERNTDYWFDRTFNVSGSVIYKFTSNTALTAEFEHSKKFMNDSSVGTYYVDRTADPNYEQFLADPFNPVYQNTEYGKQYWRRVALSEYGDAEVRDRLMSFNAAGSERRTTRENDSFYLKLEHRFASDVSMRINFGYSMRDFLQHTLSSLSIWDPDWQETYNSAYVPVSDHSYGNWGLQSGKWTQNDNTTAAYPGRRAQALHYKYDYKEYGFQIDFTKNWRTAVRQSSLLTFDYFREKSEFRQWYLRGDPTATTGRNSALRAALATMLGYPTAVQLPNAIWAAYISPDPFHLDTEISLPGGRTMTAKELYSLTPAFDTAAYPWVPRNGYDDVARMYSNVYDLDRLTYGALLSHQVSLFNERVYLIGTIRQDFSEVERKIPFDWVLSEQAAAQARHPGIDLGNPIDMSNPAVAQIVKVGQENTGNTRAMSYSTGISYGILDNKKLVAYVSYGKSFDPAMQVDPFKGTIFGNRTATGLDAGIKGILRATGGVVFQYEVAVYKIKEKNAAVQNPLWEDNSNLASEVEDLSELPDYYVPVTSKGQGMSIDIKGDNLFTPGLAMNGKIDWLDKTYATYPGRDDPTQPQYRVGGRFTNTPVRSVGAGASYKFQSGFLKGLKFGMSHTYTPARQMTYFDPATSSALAQDERWLPRQSLWHGFVSYPRRIAKRFVLIQVNVVNIFDDMTITPGSYMPNGREVRGSITLEF